MHETQTAAWAIAPARVVTALFDGGHLDRDRKASGLGHVDASELSLQPSGNLAIVVTVHADLDYSWLERFDTLDCTYRTVSSPRRALI